MIAILASQNLNKKKEFDAILKKYDMSLILRDDAGLPKDDVEETGSTFEENSLLKAQAVRDMVVSGHITEYMDSPVVADDSGLMVDALDGAPGIYSARYSDGSPYNDNNDKLLAELEGLPEEKRTACFVTVITMLFPDGKKIVARGECHGKIATERRGEGGFGYDPVFIPDGFNQTFSELGTNFKNTISHRAKALDKLEALLK